MQGRLCRREPQQRAGLGKAFDSKLKGLCEEHNKDCSAAAAVALASCRSSWLKNAALRLVPLPDHIAKH